VFEGRRDELGKWIIQDSGVFRDWQKIKILVAFADDRQEIMRGYVRSSNVSYPSDAGSARVTVTCQDESYLLDRTHRQKNWGEDEPNNDRDILQQMIQPYPLTLSANNNDRGQDGINLNQNGTDIEFLLTRARVNGYDLIFSKGKVYFGPMRLKGDAQKTIMLYAGTSTNCISLDVNTDGHQPDAVTFDLVGNAGENTTEVKLYSTLEVLGPIPAVGGEVESVEFTWKTTGGSRAHEPELRERAQQIINQFDIQRVKVSGELDGVLYGKLLKPGFPVAVDGLGERYNGTYYVDKVTHKFSYSGYLQNFSLLRNAYGDNL
jgi:hypothetical protein